MVSKLAISINFLSSKENNGECIMHSKRDWLIIKQIKLKKTFFNHLFSRYQNGLEMLMRSNDFVFNYVRLLHYKCHNINFKRGGSKMKNKMKKNEKATKKPNNKRDNKFF